MYWLLEAVGCEIQAMDYRLTKISIIGSIIDGRQALYSIIYKNISVQRLDKWQYTLSAPSLPMTGINGRSAMSGIE